MDIPVYLIHGFLESGKTTFINETISDKEFSNGARTLLIVCEEGEIEYNKIELSKRKIDLVIIEKEEFLTDKFLKDCDDFYQPHRVMIEFNGMWKSDDFLSKQLPEGWVLVQIITVIDASTYQTYLNNMKSIMVGQFRNADTIIFNRCDEGIDRISLRRSVKPVNRKAQIIYETSDGVAGDESDFGEEILPFDLDAEVIEICDDDYGIWYMDAMDHPKKYHGKTVKFLGMVYRSEKLPKQSFVPGRFAMTCCADDVAFMGMLCKIEKENRGPLQLDDLKNGIFVELTAKIRCEFYKEYHGKGPILYALSIENGQEPEEKLIYFN